VIIGKIPDHRRKKKLRRGKGVTEIDDNARKTQIAGKMGGSKFKEEELRHHAPEEEFSGKERRP